MLRVLIAVDGSECSDRAVDYVLKKTPLYKEPVELHLLTVHHHLPYGRLASMIEHDKLQQYYHEEGLATLKSARARLDAAKVPYQFHIGVGEPAEVIAGYVREKKIDQLVMGSHGRGRVGNVMLGSVANKVLHLTTVPVLLVR